MKSECKYKALFRNSSHSKLMQVKRRNFKIKYNVGNYIIALKIRTRTSLAQFPKSKFILTFHTLVYLRSANRTRFYAELRLYENYESTAFSISTIYNEFIHYHLLLSSKRRQSRAKGNYFDWNTIVLAMVTNERHIRSLLAEVVLCLSQSIMRLERGYLSRMNQRNLKLKCPISTSSSTSRSLRK